MITRSVETDIETGERLAKRGPWKLPAAIVVTFVLALTALIAASPQQFVHQVEISVVRQPTPYTQLYFTDPSALPSQLRVDRENAFSFTVANDTGSSQLYQYIVTVSEGGLQTTAQTRSVTITNGSTGTYRVNVEPAHRNSRYLITVMLSGTTQSIHFYGGTS